ncbi:MAG: hypothetical protein Fur009_4390 [Candidatus Microgenomates bacterium]
MTSENKQASFLSISSLPGHGNPFSAIAIAQLIGGQTIIFSGLPQKLARKKHEDNHHRPLTQEDLENYDNQRSGLAGIAYGMMSLAQLIINERRLHQLSDIGIFIQEHLISQVPDWLLNRWFPRGVFLAVPDVLPKQSGVNVLKKSEIVAPIVWNKQAFDELQKQGLRPLLVAPFLPEGFVGEVDFQEKELQNKIIVKSSGSGMPRL